MVKETILKRRYFTKEIGPKTVEYQPGKFYQQPARRYVVQARIDHLEGNSQPYFAITGDIYEKGPGGGWVDVGGGAIGEEAEKIIPALKGMDKWHLFGTEDGPMHYEGNAVYRWEIATGRRPFKYGDRDRYTKEERDKEARHLYDTILFGTALDHDTFNPLTEWPIASTPEQRGKQKQEFIEWLHRRLPVVMEAFRADMKKIFGTGLDEPGPVEGKPETKSPTRLFIEAHGIDMETETIGAEENPYMPDFQGHHYKCTFFRGDDPKNSYFETYFAMGYAHEDAPTAEQVLEAIASDVSGVHYARGFEDWASDLGYNPDSLSALKVFENIQKIEAALRDWLTPDQFNDLFPDFGE